MASTAWRGVATWVAAAALAAPAGAVTLEEVAAIIQADAFHDHGYTGAGSIIGNVEAGNIWDGHQTLNDGRIAQFVRFEPDTTFTYDSHATLVGGTMVADGLLDSGSASPTGGGVAYGAEAWSGQIATVFYGGGSFGITGDSLLYPLMVFGETGVAPDGQIGGVGAQTADVINSSWGLSLIHI